MKLTRKILLNPGPVTTTDSVKQALLVPDICHREQTFGELLRLVRQNLLAVAHAKKEDYTCILFGASGTGALEAVVSSVIPSQKKLLVINNGTYGQRIIDIARSYHIDVVELNAHYTQQPSLDELISLLERDNNIFAIAMVHHETSTGLLNPLQEVGKIAKDFGLTYIVDAISSFGGIPIDISSNHIDYLVTTSNKCLQGMPGMSIVIANLHKLEHHKNYARSYYFNLYKQYDSLEKTGQLAFTPPVQIVYALSQALTEYFEEGERQRYIRLVNNYQTLLMGLQELNFTYLIPETFHSKLLVLVQYPTQRGVLNFETLHDTLYIQNYTIYPTSFPLENAFRLACFGDLTSHDIEQFNSALAHAIKRSIQ